MLHKLLHRVRGFHFRGGGGNSFTFGQVTLVHQTRDHMAVFQVEIVVGAKDISGDDAGEHAAILLVVSSA